MRLGAIHTPRPDSIHPLLARVTAPMQAPPAADWHAACPPDGDPLGNDHYGNCVPCAELRAIQMRRAVVGDAWKPTTADALALYAALTGFDATTGQPDVGTDTAAAMTAWCRSGIRVNAQVEDVPLWASVAPEMIDHVRIAIAKTGPVQVTLALPAALEGADLSAWDGTPGTGAEWAKATWDYHRVICGKYDPDSFTLRTWGQDVTVGLAFWRYYVVAVDVTPSLAWAADRDVNWDALDADMKAIAAP